MDQDIQSVLAVAVVVVAAGIYIYLTFFKKRSGCGEDCGCSGTKKAFPSTPRAPKDQK